MKTTNGLITGAAALAVSWSGFSTVMPTVMANDGQKSESKSQAVADVENAENATGAGNPVRISEELPRTHFRASDLIGLNIRNRQGEEIGDIENIVLHLGEGHVEYIVMAKGEILELGGKRFAVPLTALKPMTSNEERHLQLDVTADQLAKAPDLSGEKWPVVVDYEWLGTVYTFGFRPEDNTDNADSTSGAKNSTKNKASRSGKRADSEKEPQRRAKKSADDKAPKARDRKNASRDSNGAGAKSEGIPAAVTVAVSAELSGHLAKFSDFSGLEVRSSDDRMIGEISDVVINKKTGRIAYAVVSRGGVLGIGASHVAVPMNAFTADHSDDEVVLRITTSEQRFSETPTLKESDWPTSARVSWAKPSGANERKSAKRKSDSK